MASIGEVFSNFSQKLKKFTGSGQSERNVQPGENALLQQRIRERGERLKSSVVSTYKIYKAPFEALGENSDRAAGIDRDEQSLLKAANLYKAVMDIKTEGEGEEGEVSATFISRVEIASPLTQKASLTSGGQFIYLLCWLYFEQNFREYIPMFAEKDGVFSLVFVKAENFEFEGNDREIFGIVEKEFYS